MSIAVIVQFAALAVIAGIGLCVVYAIFEMREVYADQREKFLRAISAVEEFHKLQPGLVAVLERAQSDGHALQKIALQIEVSVAALRTAITHPQRQPVMSHDPQLDFTLLKDWISANAIAAEIVDGRVFLVSIRGDAERLEIPVNEAADLEPSSGADDAVVTSLPI